MTPVTSSKLHDAWRESLCIWWNIVMTIMKTAKQSLVSYSRYIPSDVWFPATEVRWRSWLGACTYFKDLEHGSPWTTKLDTTIHQGDNPEFSSSDWNPYSERNSFSSSWKQKLYRVLDLFLWHRTYISYKCFVHIWPQDVRVQASLQSKGI